MSTRKEQLKEQLKNQIYEETRAGGISEGKAEMAAQLVRTGALKYFRRIVQSLLRQRELITYSNILKIQKKRNIREEH